MSGHMFKHNLLSFGNESFDNFLGGGFLNSSLNLFERQGPSSKLLDSVWNKSFAASTLASKNNLIHVNFNTSTEVLEDQYLSSLPLPRKVKSELLYKDVRGKSASATIKIAWRYSSRLSSPSDKISQTNQIDFGLSLTKESEVSNLGLARFVNIKDDFSMTDFFNQLETNLQELKTNGTTNIIIKDLLHPFSPVIDNIQLICKILYTLRCFSRTLEKGAILISYDTDMCKDHAHVKQHLYNLADCVVAFFSHETGQNILTGYKNIDGTLDYVKIPKIKSFGPHFQRELSDWGYRLTKNHRYFVIDELSLPPCPDDEDSRKRKASDLTKLDYNHLPLEQVGPLEDFKRVAEDLVSKQL